MRRNALVTLLLLLLTIGAIICPAAPADASQSSGDVQLLHDAWTFKDGAPENIFALAQTDDGFLWLGTPKGLFRFDGTRFELFHSPLGSRLASTNITALYAPPSGGLWVGYQFGGTSFLDRGVVTNYGGEATASRTVYGFAEDRAGAVWATSAGGLMRFDGKRWQGIGAEWNVPAGSAYEVAIDPTGTLWLLAAGALLKLDVTHSRFLIVQEGVVGQSFARNVDGFLWTPDAGTLRPVLTGGFGFLIDRAGILWAWEDGHLARRLSGAGAFTAGRLVEAYDFAVFAAAVHVDREGNIWLGGSNGLHRFYYTPLNRLDLPTAVGDFAVVADTQGALWVGSFLGQLYRASHERIESLSRLTEEVSCAYRAEDGTLWFGGTRTLWRVTNGRPTPIAVPVASVSRRIGVQAMTMDRSGAMWISMPPDGIYRLKEGAWTRFTGAANFPAGPALSEFTDVLGRVWFGFTGNRVAVVDGDRVRQFAIGDGVRIGNVTAISGRSPKVWLGGEQGLLQFDGDTFRRVMVQDEEALRGTSGIVETAGGDLWLNGLSGIVRIAAAEAARAVRDPAYHAAFERFGRREGLPGFAAQVRPLPTAIDDGHGRLWFAVTNGVVSIDPAHPRREIVAPPVTIQSVAADDVEYPARFPLALPAGTSSLHVRYDAVSLTNPDAIHFRYRLEDIDDSWRDVGAVKDVTYRNLKPRSYHLRVAASDSNGVWTNASTEIAFSILPAFYQTRWFLTLGVLSGLAALSALYLFRLKQLTRAVHVRLATQMAERERMARDLHDTLLQDVTGLLLRFHAVAMRAAGYHEVRRLLDEALDRGDEILLHARDTVRGLRTDAGAIEDLSQAFTDCALRQAADDHSVAFRVTTDGSSWTLRQRIRDEMFQIGKEAIVNAYTHADATRIEVELLFRKGWVAMVVRDNGRGIDPAILEDGGREGHWGLVGMRERADKAGGRLKIWSPRDGGTIVELKIPGAVAAASDPPSSSWRATLRALASRTRRGRTDRTDEHL